MGILHIALDGLGADDINGELNDYEDRHVVESILGDLLAVVVDVPSIGTMHHPALGWQTVTIMVFALFVEGHLDGLGSGFILVLRLGVGLVLLALAFHFNHDAPLGLLVADHPGVDHLGAVAHHLLDQSLPISSIRARLARDSRTFSQETMECVMRL